MPTVNQRASANCNFIPINLSDMEYDKKSEYLIFKLSGQVDKDWINIFQNPKKSFRAFKGLFAPHLFVFVGDTAKLPMSVSDYEAISENRVERFNTPFAYEVTLDNLKKIFEMYLDIANSSYKEML